MRLLILFSVTLFLWGCEKENVKPEINKLDVILEGSLISRYYYSDSYELIKKIEFSSDYIDSFIIVYNQNKKIDSLNLFRKTGNDSYIYKGTVLYHYNTSNELIKITGAAGSIELTNSNGQIKSIESNLWGQYRYDYFKGNIISEDYYQGPYHVKYKVEYDSGINIFSKFGIVPSLLPPLDYKISVNNPISESKLNVKTECPNDPTGNSSPPCNSDTTYYYLQYKNDYEDNILVKQTITDTVDMKITVYDYKYSKVNE